MTRYRIIKDSSCIEPYFIQKQKRFLWWKWWVYEMEPSPYGELDYLKFSTYQEAKEKIQALYQKKLDRIEGIDENKIEVIEEFDSLPL